jgi:uncharacterized protein YbjT (DUF2867 family)
MKRAIIFGATGLVGKSLLSQLIDSETYSGIMVFTRKGYGKHPAKVTELVTDMKDPAFFKQNIAGDDLFICLGTTRKKAGSVKAMEVIDRDLPLMIASAAIENGVKRVAVVSSVGADASSGNYYLRIKGEMEAGIKEKPFQRTIIARPSILFGNRNEKRAGERAGILFMKLFGFLFAGPLRKYRGIEASDVAKAMLLLISNGAGTEVVESDRLSTLVRK